MNSVYRVVEARRIEQYRLRAAAAPTTVAQLSRGPFYGKSEYLFHPAVSIGRRYCNQTIFEAGQVPAQHFIFTLHTSAPQFYSGGLPYGVGDISSVRPGSRYNLVSCRECRYTTISVEQDLLLNALDATAQQRMQHLFDSDTRVRLSFDPNACELVDTLHDTFSQLATGSLRDSDVARLESLHGQLLQQLNRLLVNARLNKIRLNARANIFRKAVEYIEQVEDRSPGVEEVANAVGTSRRNLEITFANGVDVPPKEYINNLRLNRVRAALLAPNAGDTTISHIAGRYGYVHMSNFSRSYQALFNELPSQTVERTLPKTAEPA